MSNTLSIEQASPETQRPRLSRRPGLLTALDRLPQTSLWVIFAVLIMRTVLVTACVAVLYAVDPARWPGSLMQLNAVIMVVDAATLITVAALLRRHGIGLGALLGRFTGSDLGWGLLLTVIIFVGGLAANFLGNLIVFHGAPPRATLPAVPLWVGLGALVAAVTIGVAEEVLYRGYALDRLVRRFGPLPATMITSVFFALQHAPMVWMSPGAVASKLIFTCLAGIMFAGLMLWRRRLSQVIIGHVIFDLIGLGIPTLLAAVAS